MRLHLAIGLAIVIISLAACGGSGPTLATPARPPLSIPTAVPTSALVTATPEPANVAPTASPVAQAQETVPAATEVPVAPVVPNSKLVGTYSGVLPAADSAARIVTLDLALDGTATMTTQFIGKSTPSIESGTWVGTNDTADATFTQIDGQPEDNRISWKLQGNGLVTTAYDKAQYGTAGLPLARVGTGEIVETNFQGVSFSFDSSLAKSAQGTALPARPVEQAPGLGGGAPQSIQFVFDGQSLPDYFDPTKPQVHVYPVEGLKALDPTVAEGVTALQNILATGTITADAQTFVFPLIPASQVFRAQTHWIDFVDGKGISFVTYYAQDVAPLRPAQVFWTFQGITLDNKFYVSVFMPIRSPALPQETKSISGTDYDGFVKEYKTYLNNIVTTLDSLPPAGFTPNLNLLENMARSINASPVFSEITPAAPTPASAPSEATPPTAPTLATAPSEATPPTAPTPASASVAATPPPQATNPGATPPPVSSNSQTVTAEYDGIRLSFDSRLAQSAQGVTISAVPVDTNAPALGGGVPDHDAFAFNGDKITAEANPFQPQVRIYRTADLKALDPNVTREVLALKTLLSVDAPQIQEPLPVFPPLNAQQMIHPLIKYLKFNTGEGVRFVTFYAQDVAPITNDGLFYTFQGMSADGKYYITAYWAVKTDKIPDSYEDAEIGDFDAWAKKFETYLADTGKMLNNLPADAFTPNLELLDKMIESLQMPK